MISKKYDIKKQIPALNKNDEWLGVTYFQWLQHICFNLGVAFDNFFERRTGDPSFKSKHDKQLIHQFICKKSHQIS
ncbi:MAG: hypothetical protein HLUCCO16_05995 [Phormidium sp. OSCR]|nr:MAG: hypothetical protein HLUCCO16_05995 [Phormidium sp. OSCR]